MSSTIASFSLILILAFSLTFSGQNAPAEAQIKTCSQTPIPAGKVAANGDDGNVPQNTVDNSLSTRWSNLGLPSVIEYDLGASSIVCYVDIAWYRGDLRVNTFTIAVSNDNVNFQTILKLGKSSGQTNSLERYDVPDTNAKFMRISVTGNTENNYASITEVDIYSDVAASSCTPPYTFRVAANGNDGNIPKNTLDNDLNTRWSNLGFPSWIRYDFGSLNTVCHVDIAWYRGNSESKYLYNICFK